MRVAAAWFLIKVFIIDFAQVESISWQDLCEWWITPYVSTSFPLTSA